jgi:hypothetical protein
LGDEWGARGGAVVGRARADGAGADSSKRSPKARIESLLLLCQLLQICLLGPDTSEL